jgi:hypothetical protein
MIVESVDVVFYTATFILPGFIIKNVVDVLNPPKKTNDGAFFLACLAYSLINCAIWSWAYILIRPLAGEKNVLFWLVALSITIFGAILLSLIVALLKQWRIVYIVADKLNIKMIDPTPTAWDYWFSKQESSLVLITLIDGNVIRGWFSSNSFASSDPEERDIFVEKVYTKFSDSEQWVEQPENNGIYISKDVIKQIEFKISKEVLDCEK